ncbi:TPA: hypothetical protein ACTXXA_001684 [Legionella anisa]
MEALRRENQLLHCQLEAEKQTTKPASEATSEVSQLKSRLDSLHHKSPEVEKQPKTLPNDVQSEVSQLRSQFELLRLENNKLKEELRNAKLILPVVEPKLPGFDIKAGLLVALGALRLNQEDTIRIRDTIIAHQEDKQLAEVDTEIQRLKKINEFIENINKGILERAGFFSSDPPKKTKAIEAAFQELSVDDKYRIATLSAKNIDEELSKDR